MCLLSGKEGPWVVIRRRHRILPEWTSTHQRTIHWMPTMTQLWMNLNRVNIWIHVHNQFLPRNRRHGVAPLLERSQVTTHICCLLGPPDQAQGVMQTATTAFIPNIWVVIGYGQVKSRPSSHRLCPVTWLEQAGYQKKWWATGGFFPVTGLLSPVM
jgi:hypothetical protein